MSHTRTTDEAVESIHRDYILDVHIVACSEHDPDTARYRFEAPHHRGVTFEDAETAELYADVYFDVNGFREAGTGDRGIPPEIVQAGKDTLAAYLLTQPKIDVHWIASFYGRTPGDIERYISWVRERAEEIRQGALDRGIA